MPIFRLVALAIILHATPSVRVHVAMLLVTAPTTQIRTLMLKKKLVHLPTGKIIMRNENEWELSGVDTFFC